MARVAYFTKDFERAVSDARLGPNNFLTQLVEILSLAQLSSREEVQNLVCSFRARHASFDPQEFIRIYPLTAPGAKELFLEGVE
jgi:hypothetical protein